MACICYLNLPSLNVHMQGIIGSGVSYYIQSWSISRRGPLFSAMFSPLMTVIVTILACLFLHEELYIGRYSFQCHEPLVIFIIQDRESEEGSGVKNMLSYPGWPACWAPTNQPSHYTYCLLVGLVKSPV